MFILINKLNYEIIETLSKCEIVENKWIKSNNDSLIQLDSINLIEIETIPDNAKFYKNNKFYIDNPELVEEQNKKIIEELAKTDLNIIRIIEDIIEQGNFKINDKSKEIIAKRKELRKNLY